MFRKMYRKMYRKMSRKCLGKCIGKCIGKCFTKSHYIPLILIIMQISQCIGPMNRTKCIAPMYMNSGRKNVLEKFIGKFIGKCTTVCNTAMYWKNLLENI